MVLRKTEVMGEKLITMPLFPTTNLTWNDLGLKPVLSGDRPTTNRPTHGTVQYSLLEFVPG